MIRPYLGDIINNHKNQGEWKIQLSMLNNFISSKDSDEIRNMHTKSDKTKIMLGSETHEIIEKLFESLFQKYIDSAEWLKNKKATINPKNNDDKCFQYASTIALNYQIIEHNPEWISKIKLFIDQYNWKK